MTKENGGGARTPTAVKNWEDWAVQKLIQDDDALQGAEEEDPHDFERVGTILRRTLDDLFAEWERCRRERGKLETAMVPTFSADLSRRLDQTLAAEDRATEAFRAALADEVRHG